MQHHVANNHWCTTSTASTSLKPHTAQPPPPLTPRSTIWRHRTSRQSQVLLAERIAQLRPARQGCQRGVRHHSYQASHPRQHVPRKQSHDLSHQRRRLSGSSTDRKCRRLFIWSSGAPDPRPSGRLARRERSSSPRAMLYGQNFKERRHCHPGVQCPRCTGWAERFEGAMGRHEAWRLL